MSLARGSHPSFSRKFPFQQNRQKAALKVLSAIARPRVPSRSDSRRNKRVYPEGRGSSVATQKRSSGGWVGKRNSPYRIMPRRCKTWRTPCDQVSCNRCPVYARCRDGTASGRTWRALLRRAPLPRWQCSARRRWPICLRCCRRSAAGTTTRFRSGRD